MRYTRLCVYVYICSIINLYKVSSNIYWWLGCRTVALWFYFLVSDHKATDPEVQKKKKKLQFTAQISLRSLQMFFSTFHH
jgi:hypothetical protein